MPLASGFPDDREAVHINANARVLGALVQAGKTIVYTILQTRYAYLVVAKGAVTVNGLQVEERDGIAISAEEEIEILAIKDSEFILVDAG